MTFPQKHEDQPVAPALSRGSRQEESHATPLVSDPEDVETAIANLELDRAGLDARHDSSVDRFQGIIDLGTPAPSNPTPLGPPGLRDATKPNITESVDPERKFLREERPLDPITRPAIRPDRPDLGIPEPSSLAAPVSSASTESGDSFEPSDNLKHLVTDRHFIKWRSWARDKKILTDKHENILKAAPFRLHEARRKSFPSPSGTSLTIVAPSLDHPLPEYAISGRKSLPSPPDAYFTAVASIPDPPPRDVPPGTKSFPSRAPEASSATMAPIPTPLPPKYVAPRRRSLISTPEAPFTTVAPISDPRPMHVPPGTKSFPSPPEVSSAAAALIPDPLPPKYAPRGVSGSIPAMGEAEAFASHPIFPSASSPRDAVPPENTALGAPKSASMVGKITALASRPRLDAPPPRRHDDPTLPTLPPHSLDASPPPRRHDYPTSPPDRLDAQPPRRHDNPTLLTLPPRSLDASPPPRCHDYPTLPPRSIDTWDIPPESIDTSDIPPSAFCPFRKTFSCDITALPTEFTSHPARLAIVRLLELEPDNTNQLWCRRSVYTEENFEQWVEWSSPSKTHRDQRPRMKDLDKETLLKAPDLLAADKKILEDAWVEYRPYLLDKIQQALSVGCDWKRVLQRLNLAFSDSDHGYPRLKQYTEQALQDNVLIKYPLLHADVLIYHLDMSYSEKGTRNPNSTRWDHRP